MGVLYIVATPIGNLEDITIRAIRILLETPVLACEDTRHSGMLLKLLKDRYAYLFPDIADAYAKKYISVRDWNEVNTVGKVIEELKNSDVALVSDAGTPLLSDPGFKVVRAARQAGYKVIPLPGAFAGAAAVSASGLPTNKIMFWGFLPKKWELAPETTHIIYESPVRVRKTVKILRDKYPNAQITIARELTKVHEQFISDDQLMQMPEAMKGEMTILVYIPAITG